MHASKLDDLRFYNLNASYDSLTLNLNYFRKLKDKNLNNKNNDKLDFKVSNSNYENLNFRKSKN